MKVCLTYAKFSGRWHGFPLGLAYISSYLKEKGLEVVGIDEGALLNCGMTKKDTEKLFLKYSPDIVGISITTPNYEDSLNLIHRIKNLLPKIKIVVGGPHVSFCYETVLRNHPEVDFAMIREGEKTLYELIECLKGEKSIEKIKGLAYRKNQEIVFTPRPLLENLDILPFPDRGLFLIGDDKLKTKLQNFYNIKEDVKSTSFMSTRGCTYNCSFCASRRLWGWVRQRSIKNTVDEIEFLIKKGYQYIYFEDDDFTLGKDGKLDEKRILNFYKEIRKRNIKFYFGFGTRIDAINKKVLIKLKEVGLEFIYFGIESPIQKILDKIGKKIKIKEVENAFKILNNLHIPSYASMQFGLEGENDGTVDKTIKWLKDMETKYKYFRFVISFNSLWPGATLTYKYGLKCEDFEPDLDKDKIQKQLGVNFIRFDKFFVKSFAHYGGIFSPPYLTKSKIKEIYKKLVENFGKRDFGQFVYKSELVPYLLKKRV